MTQEQAELLDEPIFEDPDHPSWPRRLIVLAAAITLLAIAGQRIHLPYVVLAPGPTRDAAKLTKIAAQVYSSQGSFHLTTALVKDDDGIPIGVALEAMFDPDEIVIRRDIIFPPDSTRKESDQRNAADMSESQLDASVAALKHLGLTVEPDGAFVQELSEGSAARNKITPGDVIVAVDGQPVSSRDDLTPLVTQHAIGDKVTVTVRRSGELEDVSFATSESPESKGKAILGVTVVQNYKLPFEIKIDAGDIGGPSAGLVFALTIYDLLEPSDLTKGRKIAGTGVIRPDGQVEPVGAVEQKISGAAKLGASVFLVPKQELAEATRAAKGTSMKVIGVSDLREAIERLSDG